MRGEEAKLVNLRVFAPWWQKKKKNLHKEEQYTIKDCFAALRNDRNIAGFAINDKTVNPKRFNTRRVLEYSY